MMKKIFAVSAILIVLIFGGVLYMLNVQKSSTGLDAKEEKIIKHGFRLLEEQIGTYIKENYSGISKIEFSPIFIQGGKDNPPFTADVLPVIYKTLPETAKIKAELDGTDENIAALVDTKKLKNVSKNKEGSPKAEIVYNLEIKRGEYWKWH